MSSPIDSIHSKVLQENCDIFAPLLQNSFHLRIEANTFSETLKKVTYHLYLNYKIRKKCKVRKMQNAKSTNKIVLHQNF